jgi:hypothetical protein
LWWWCGNCGCRVQLGFGSRGFEASSPFAYPPPLLIMSRASQSFPKLARGRSPHSTRTPPLSKPRGRRQVGGGDWSSGRTPPPQTDLGRSPTQGFLPPFVRTARLGPMRPLAHGAPPPRFDLPMYSRLSINRPV